MKKLSVAILLCLTSHCWAFDRSFFDDVTLHDGDTGYLNIHKSASPLGEFTHSVKFNYNYTKISSEACYLSSDTTINCYANILSVNYNPATHSAIATSSDGSHVYYEKGFEPASSPLVGVWHQNGTSYSCRGHISQYTLTLHHATPGARQFKADVMSDDRRNQMPGMTFKLIQDEKTHQLTLVDHIESYDRDIAIGLYDENNNAIYDFDKITSKVKLNSSGEKFDEACGFTKVG